MKSPTPTSPKHQDRSKRQIQTLTQIQLSHRETKKTQNRSGKGRWGTNNQNISKIKGGEKHTFFPKITTLELQFDRREEVPAVVLPPTSIHKEEREKGKEEVPKKRRAEIKKNKGGSFRKVLGGLGAVCGGAGFGYLNVGCPESV